ncbi:hypothetical protein [Stella sp.]|uniref:hypothetical protein n=1 Tax=Stella sp. TaxID=2912054 RepID=UPI0035B0FA98
MGQTALHRFQMPAVMAVAAGRLQQAERRAGTEHRSHPFRTEGRPPHVGEGHERPAAVGTPGRMPGGGAHPRIMDVPVFGIGPHHLVREVRPPDHDVLPILLAPVQDVALCHEGDSPRLDRLGPGGAAVGGGIDLSDQPVEARCP